MKKTGFKILSLALLMSLPVMDGCQLHDLHNLEQYFEPSRCYADCSRIEGHIFTEQSLPVKGVTVGMFWDYGCSTMECFFTFSNLLGSAVSDDDGHYAINFYVEDAYRNDPNGVYYLNFSFPDGSLFDDDYHALLLKKIERGDTLTRVHHVFRKGTLRVAPDNVADIPAGDYIACEVYARDEVGLKRLGIFSTLWTAADTLQAAANQWNYIIVSKKKGNVYSEARDSILIPLSRMLTYPLHY